MLLELQVHPPGVRRKELGIYDMINIKYEPIIPKKFMASLDPAKLKKELYDALDHTGNIINDDFDKTVRTWKKAAKFKKKGPEQYRSGLAVTISTDDEIYFYIDEGTKAHIIKPRRAKRLGFRSGYKAKTRVGVVGSRAGGASGPFVTAKQVMHPGFPARKFAKTIAKRRQKNLVNLTKLAFNRSFRFGG